MTSCILVNRRGYTIKERIMEEFNYAKMIDNADTKRTLAIKALGSADIAVEFGLITYTEWTYFVKEYFQIE